MHIIREKTDCNQKMKCGYLVPSKVWRTFFFYCSTPLVQIRESMGRWIEPCTSTLPAALSLLLPSFDYTHDMLPLIHFEYISKRRLSFLKKHERCASFRKVSFKSILYSVLAMSSDQAETRTLSLPFTSGHLLTVPSVLHRSRAYSSCSPRPGGSSDRHHGGGLGASSRRMAASNWSVCSATFDKTGSRIKSIFSKKVTLSLTVTCRSSGSVCTSSGSHNTSVLRPV